MQTAMSSLAMSFVHMLIGVAGAAIAGYGGQKVGEDKIIQEQLEACSRGKLQPKQTRAQLTKNCEKKYDISGAKMHNVLMYLGCGFIVGAFMIIGILNMFGGGGMMGGVQWQQ